jgi:hypothetical protein
MALTQDQVNWWFDQNPNATAADIAAAVQSIGGLDANEGLAGMIANRYAIAEPEVTSYYNAYTAPKAETPAEAIARIAREQAEAKRIAEANLAALQPTFTDTITAGKPTTEAELFTALGSIPTGTTGATTNAYFQANPDVAAAYAANSYGMSANDFANAHWNSSGKTEGRASPDGTTPAATTAATTTAAATAAPADNITSTGGITKSATRPTSGGVSNVIEGDDIATQIAQLPQEYAHWARSADQRTMELIRKSDGVVLDRRTVGDFSDLDLAKIGLSFIPGAGPILAGLNVADAARTGNWTQAAIGATGLIPGMQNVNTALRVGQAVDAGNGLGAITALAGNTDVQNVLGLGNANIGGFTAKDIMAAGSLAQAASSNNTAGVLTSLGALTGSSDTVLAGKALALYNRIQNGDVKALGEAVTLSNSVSGSTTGTATAGTGSTTVGDFEDTEVTRLRGLGYTNAQIQEYFRNLDNITGVFDTVTGGTGNDTVTGATGNDVASFTRSLGTLDQLDTTRTADEFADFLASIGITNTTQLTDSGLSNQDILDLINAGVDTVTVTGGTGNDTTTGVTGVDTITGGGGNDDTVTVVGATGCAAGFHDNGMGLCVADTDLDCPEGYAPNEDGTQCVAIVEVVGNKCLPGQVYDEDLKKCVPIKSDECAEGFHDNGMGLCVADTDLDCPEGYEPNEAGTECIPIVDIVDNKCLPGQVYDEDLKKCVPIKTTECAAGFHDDGTGLCVADTDLDCPEGYEPNEDGTECIPIVEVVDNKCLPGQVYDEDLKKCVPIKTTECAVGFHDNGTGLCVADTDLDCPEGYEPNEAGTECVAKVTVEACKDGKVRDPITGQCVLPTKECAEGFHDDGTGLCVPDDDEECKPGFELVGGKCEPVCKEGYLRNLETGQCEKIEDKTCPVGQVKDANGKCVPIKNNNCQPGFEKVNDVCVPVCQTGYKRVDGVCKKITTDTATPATSALSAEGEKIDPIYAGAMDDFDLFATLEELLSENPDKKAAKKDSKKSKDKTKMATGGHLDDLLAEQMTVDDLLNLLR